MERVDRQNGQHIAAEMGVVVQQMVDADTAGVLFTCDPINGDPRKILITSNYGLGEVRTLLFSPLGKYKHRPKMILF